MNVKIETRKKDYKTYFNGSLFRKSQVLGVIKYINGLYSKEHDYTPLPATPKIKKAIQNKIIEFKTQKALIQYLKKHRDDLASIHGASLWLQGKLNDKHFSD